MANKGSARPSVQRALAQPVSGGRRHARRKQTRGIPRAIIALGALLTVAIIAVVFWLSQAAGSTAGAAIGQLHTDDYHSLVFSPTDPKVLFFGYHNGLQRSDDGGRTWQPIVTRTNFDAMGIGINRADPRQLYIAGHDIFQMSRDAGATWQPVANNLPGQDLHGFAMSPDNSVQLYAFVADHGVFSSTDGGTTWQLLSDKLPGDVMSLTATGGNPPTLYAAGMGSGLLRSADGGKDWAPANQGLGPAGARAIAADPAAPKTLYGGGEDGLYKSTDAGTSWGKLPFPGANVVAIAVSPAQPSVVEVIGLQDRTGLVYRSEDGGATWVAR